MKYSLGLFVIFCLSGFIFNFAIRNRTHKVADFHEHILEQNQKLISHDKLYYAIMKVDGNLVVHSSTNKKIWSSNTKGQGQAPYKLIMQASGNLVIHDKINNSIWNSHTHGKGTGPYKLTMQDDGKLVLYDNNKFPWWASISSDKE
jgi:hypothetical protein